MCIYYRQAGINKYLRERIGICWRSESFSVHGTYNHTLQGVSVHWVEITKTIKLFVWKKDIEWGQWQIYSYWSRGERGGWRQMSRRVSCSSLSAFLLPADVPPSCRYHRHCAISYAISYYVDIPGFLLVCFAVYFRCDLQVYCWFLYLL